MSVNFILPKSGAKIIARWPVKILLPTENGPVEQTLVCLFEVLSEADLKPFIGLNLPAILDASSGDNKKSFVDPLTKLLERVWVGAPELKDENDKPVKWSKSVLKNLLQHRFVRSSVYQEYFACIEGRAVKN